MVRRFAGGRHLREFCGAVVFIGAVTVARIGLIEI
jgi:choline-glycine betaine transporter